MPYVSDAQRRLFHSPGSPVSKKTVAEFDRATKGMSLPERVSPVQQKAHGGTVEVFERRFDRRKKDGVERPRKETDLSFAAHLVQISRRNPLPRFTRVKDKP